MVEVLGNGDERRPEAPPGFSGRIRVLSSAAVDRENPKEEGHAQKDHKDVKARGGRDGRSEG